MGYAHNLADGDVELLLCGDEENVGKMLLWLNDGPPQAEVTNVETKQVPWQDHNHFSIG